jgi:hypothetical protein
MALAGHRRCPHAPIPLELPVVVRCCKVEDGMLKSFVFCSFIFQICASAHWTLYLPSAMT